MSLFGSCSICGKEILEHQRRDRHHQSVGWFADKPRRAGGEHTKGKYPHNTGAYAHGKCIEDAHRKQKRGIPVQQTGLF